MRSRVAVDRFEQARENVAHRPRRLAAARADAGAEAVGRAIELGCRFLARRQRRDGSWHGFLLLPGASTSWLTAHVAFTLESVSTLDEACARAADRLERTGALDGGWGYNRRVGPDCDSTAQALLVLRRFDRRVERFLLAGLQRAELPDGGYPTYPRRGADDDDGWRTAHPEVTALVAETFARYGLDEQAGALRAWLATQLQDGLLASYWWPGPAYSLWVQARTGLVAEETAGRARAVLGEVRTTPQLAMAVAAGAILGSGGTAPGVAHLVRTQLADGSWPCVPCLRVTHPGERDAATATRGPVAADRTRVFSTAHAVAALTAARRQDRVEHGDSAGRTGFDGWSRRRQVEG